MPASDLFASEMPLAAPVLIVEDDAPVRSRLQRLLLRMGYAEDALCWAASVAQAQKLIAEEPLALALVDLGLPDGSGLELIAQLRQQSADVMILVISAWSTEDAILGALRAGATGYLLKERDDFEVQLAIHSVLRGGAPIDPFIARRIIQELQATPAVTEPVVTATDLPGPGQASLLSGREHQILDLVANGLTNREIAEQLHLSRYTVECHIKRIYQKLAVGSRTRAVYEARTRGWLA